MHRGGIWAESIVISTPACSTRAPANGCWRISGMRNRYPEHCASRAHAQALQTFPSGGAKLTSLGAAKGRQAYQFAKLTDRIELLRHQAPSKKTRPLASGHRRYQHLQHAMREGIRQPLPELSRAPSQRLRLDGRRPQAQNPMASASAWQRRCAMTNLARPPAKPATSPTLNSKSFTWVPPEDGGGAAPNYRWDVGGSDSVMANSRARCREPNHA